MCTLVYFFLQVVNAYFKLISTATNGDVFAFSTFFYSKLASCGCEAVQRWTRGTNVLHNRLLLFPIHLGMHWCLASVNPAKQQISYYDSLQGCNTACMRNLQRYIEQISLGTQYSDCKWDCSTCKDTPEQLNSSDCGVFVCALARCLAANQPFSFVQNDIPNIRKQIVLELLLAKLYYFQ